MKHLCIALIIFALSLSAIRAQNTELEACEKAEVTAILVAIRDADFADKYAEVTAGIKTMDIASGDLLDVIEDLDDLQLEWWGEIVPEFPSCTEAAYLTLVGGRMLDEMLVATLIGQLAFEQTLNDDSRTASDLQERFANHVELWNSFQEAFLGTITDLTAAIDE